MDSANTKLQELEQQIADAQNKVNDASTVKASAEQALQAALAEVSRITGLPVVGGNYGSSPIPPVAGTYSGPPVDLPLDSFANRSSTFPTVEPQSLGQTFATYQPPDIACERSGAWAAVDASGNGIKQGSQQRVNFGVFHCDVATPGPGEAGKFNGIPDRAPDSYRYVFANTEQVGLPGSDPSYNFDTGIWTTSAGTFLNGKQVNVK